MLIIKVEGSQNLEKALKKYKRKFDKTKVVKELRDRKQFTKKSIKNREQKKKAIYVQEKFGHDE